jgi:hypothetical protein
MFFSPPLSKCPSFTLGRQNNAGFCAFSDPARNLSSVCACVPCSSGAPGWLNEADVQFFLGAAAPNPETTAAAEGAGEDTEAMAVVQVRMCICACVCVFE